MRLACQLTSFDMVVRSFDISLRQRNPSWGIRDLEEVSAAASAEGLALQEHIAMPANNFLLHFVKTPR